MKKAILIIAAVIFLGGVIHIGLGYGKDCFLGQPYKPLKQ